MRYEERRELDEPVAQGLLQNIGDGILLTDREEEIQFMNPAAEKILGVTGEAESARFSAVCPLVKEPLINSALRLHASALSSRRRQTSA